MKKHRFTPALALLALALLVLPAAQAADVDSFIRGQLNANGRADVFVKMADDADLSTAVSMTERVARLNWVHDTLVANADRTQAPIREFLRGRGIDFTVFWINNSLFVEAAEADLVRELAAFDGVAYLTGNETRPLITPHDFRMAPEPQGIEWGVSRINAPDVWGAGNTAEGIVVASIDSGVRWTHDALQSQYRGTMTGSHDYNWWDPQESLAVPTDTFGHGTHVTGTMVGDDGGSNQVGVAPGAKWIAAEGCPNGSCPNFDLTTSAQWIACPTDRNGNNPNCSMAPHVVNNSWGGGGGSDWYKTFVDAWIAAGIMPVFSAGNSGPGCSTLGSPGDNANNFGVASTTSANQLSSFSSRGPSVFGNRNMPDISAPGSNVRSSWNTSDSAYASISGTSMAAPHVAASYALLVSDHPGFALAQYFKRMRQKTCKPILIAPTGAQSCGGVDWDDFPSNHYGAGLLDVAAANGTNASPCQ